MAGEYTREIESIEENKKKGWMMTGKNLIQRRTTKQLIEDALLTRFHVQEERQEKNRREFVAKKVQELLILRRQQRDFIFEKFHASMHATKLKEQYASAMQRALRASWHNILGLEFIREQKEDKDSEVATHFNKYQSEEAAKDIAEFETKTGFELGAEVASAPPSGGKKPPPNQTPKKKMSKTVQPVEEPPFKLDPKSLEEKRKTEEKEELEAQEGQRMIDEEESMRYAEEYATVRAAQEAEEAEKQHLLKEQEMVAQDTWLAQHQELEKKNLADLAVIRTQEHELCMMYFNDKADEINEEYNRWRVDIQAKREKRLQKHSDFCFDIVLQWVSMAECINEYRLEIGKRLPAHEWREWKNLFIKGAILPVVLPRPPTPAEPPSEKELRLAKEELEAYLQEKGDYANAEGIEPIGKNKELGKFLVDIDCMAESLAEPFKRPDLSKSSLMISVVGVPHAGKTSVAHHLEVSYGILLIEWKKVQDLAINYAIAEEERIKAELAAQPPPDWSEGEKEGEIKVSPDKLSEKARLGLQVKSAIENNSHVPDDVITRLMFLTMLHPEEYVPLVAPAPAAAAPSAKKKSTAAKGTTPGVGNLHRNGFVLDGFPQTSGQAMAMEKCLTGIDFEAQEAKNAKASKIAPPPEPGVRQLEKSGLDAYLVIESPPEDEVLRKLSASVIDPAIGCNYHPLTNPVPPNDKTGIVERLQPVESVEVIRAKLATEAEITRDCFKILRRFDNLLNVPQHLGENGIMTPEVEHAMAAINILINSKARYKAIQSAADAAKSAVEVATQANQEVETASNAAKEMAKVFFNAKLAEVKAEVKAEQAIAARSEAPSITISSEAAVKMLDEITKAVQGAQDAAAASLAAAEQAQNHAHDSQMIEGDPQASNISQEEAEKALAVARAETAKAAAASANASALLEKAKAMAASAKASATLVKAKDKAAGFRPPALPPSNRPPAAAPSNRPPPMKESPEEFVKPPPDPVLVEKVKNAELVHEIWEKLEKKYLETIQEAFRLLIYERERTIPLLIEVKRNFIALLQQDNGKQDLFDDFQGRWNRIELGHRRNKVMRARLHEEGSRFGETLRSLARERLQNGKDLEQRYLEDLLDERTETFTYIFTMLVQAELDRHIESCGLLHEHYTKRVGSSFSSQFRCSLSSIRRPPDWRVGTPRWLTPLEGSYPEFYVVLSEALSKAGNLLDVIAGRDGWGTKTHPRKPVTRRMSGRRLTWMREVNPKSREEVPLELDVDPAIAREHQIFSYRVELLARTACKYLAELQPICDGAYGHLDEWLMRRCDHESALIEDVRSVIIEAAEECIPLWYRVWMEIDEFKVEEEQITTMVHVPPEPIIDLTPWHIKVMESLSNKFKAFNGDFATTQEVTQSTLSAIDDVYQMWRNLPEHKIYPRLPRYKSRRYGHFQHWANLTNDIVEQSCGNEDPGISTVIQWQPFLVSLADAHFDYIISAATLEDIVQARTDFFMVVATKQPGHPSEGCITLDDFLNIKMWFDREDFDEYSDYDTNNDEDAAMADNYNLSKSLKIYIFSALERSNQRYQYKTVGLPWQTLLLYLCRDACLETALRKVFTVIASTISPLCQCRSPDEAQLNPTELIQALYPSGIDGAIDAGCMTWTIEDIKDVLFKADLEKATPAKEPRTLLSYVSSDTTPAYEKDTISQFFDSRSSSHQSQMSEFEQGCTREFLSNAMLDSVSSKEGTVTPWQELEEHELTDAPPQQQPIPARLTVEDCVKLSATAKLCSSLAAIFRQHSVNVTQIASDRK
ncbi:uncharacterized protein [Physcomitrium patens]|uniref:uncharacterized protein isoform X4 n=1 Tax=Physcomitrium patens TaxID=3218 RepID=UPI003CCD2EC1